ncbi:glyoxalase/Bleomycin resistance protein/Dioxygenase superfamily protein [Asticcacaulis biprosthecium C19]|uniref:Glyoxalase/Bleomycin resistance protein/Dioxygenase superfamily protein n=1 Tax=Asticcacaulis biprosthecium C19 TaxID=715226 RepID=F4QTM6_9CAUL|nr:VOC family protein [Asticcacaulis biprosthecium]EGF89176.1 glyoxalase/Bleomycin resistance protein/Dioxygenase superfamily protein [Asticcacaulis biprosthecium C19]
MISIQNIDHVVFRVRDLDRSVKFYMDVLGAQFEQHQTHVDLYQLRVGTSLIDLVPVDGVIGRKGGPAPGPDGHNVDHVYFRVAPWDEAGIIAHLSAHGIIAEVANRYGADGVGPSIYLTDPDGNRLELKGPAVTPPVEPSGG